MVARGAPILGESASANVATTDARDRTLRAGAAVFWAAAIFYGAWLIWRAFLPLEIDYDEAWNAWQAQVAIGGAQPLYPGPDALITNNYPPLSFYLLGMGARVTGIDLILLGRLVSLLGLGACAGAVAVIVRQLGGSRPAAGLGAAWYLATMVRHCSGYVGMNDPTLLALGMMAWALALFVHRHQTGRSTDVAVLLMVAAGFVKHSLLATPATALAWLWLEGDYRKAARATLVGVLAAGAALAACVGAFGWAFAQQLFLYKRSYSLRLLWEWRQLLMIGIALACGLLSTWRRRTPETRLVFVFLVIGLSVFTLCRAGEGVDVNAAFELILATAIALALALDRLDATWFDKWLSPQAVRWALLAGLIATLLHAPDPRPYLFWISPGFHQATTRRARAAEAEIAHVRTLPGRVFCTTATVCFRAGKSFVYDEFAIYQRVVTGVWADAERTRKLASARIRMEAGTDVAAWN